MEVMKIDNTDIIFKDIKPGQGKLIISDDSLGYNFSYTWGAMESRTVKDFVISMNSGYFVGKLGVYGNGDLDVRKTFTALRKILKEQLEDNGYPWYVETVFQKNIRKEFNDLRKRTYDANRLIDELGIFPSNLDFSLIQDRNVERDLRDFFENIFCEPWHSFIYKEREENIFLSKLHKKIKKQIRNERKIR